MNDREARLQQHGREIDAGLGRLYGHFPRPGPDSNSISHDETKERRRLIAEDIQAARGKLEFNTFDRLKLPVKERPDIVSVIRENLLGLINDDVLISDMFPQDNSKMKRIKIEADLLWQHIFPLLTPPENGIVSTALSSLRKFYFHTHADKIKGQARINALMKESLEPEENATFKTVCDLRRISLQGWNSIVGFGLPTANLMSEAFKKIEILTE